MLTLKKIKEKDSVTPEWTLIEEEKSNKVDALFSLYEKDKPKAKIYYHLNKGHFTVVRKLLFEFPNGDFKFVIIHKTYGISSTNKMYSREKTIKSVMYKNKKFYSYDNTYKKAFVCPLTFGLLHNFNSGFKNHEFVIGYLTTRFGWLRYVSENTFWDMSFNTIISKKLFNLKAMLRYRYNCPYPIAKFVHAYCITTPNPKGYLTAWKQIRNNLINIENLSESMFKNNIFQDACKMGQMVSEKINCSWGEKRLTLEHDKWSKIVTNVLLENEPLKILNVNPIYVEFAKHSGLELLTTNHELIAEGKRMNHCVATYANTVDNGSCGIYKAFGGTLELRKNGPKLYISQYRNHSNNSMANDIYNKVDDMVLSFKPEHDSYSFYHTVDSNDLPF